MNFEVKTTKYEHKTKEICINLHDYGENSLILQAVLKTNK
jgi:hypothetical protein